MEKDDTKRLNMLNLNLIRRKSLLRVESNKTREQKEVHSA